MTRSADDGPWFLSDLIRDLEHLRQQQQGTEKRLEETAREHRQIERRIDAIENTLRAIGCRESDLSADLAAAEGRRQGQNRLMTALTAPALLLAAWFLSLTWYAIQHAQNAEPGRQQRLREEFQRRELPPQMGPPVPDRLKQKP